MVGDKLVKPNREKKIYMNIWAIIYLGRYLNSLSICVLLNFFLPQMVQPPLGQHDTSVKYKKEIQVRIQLSLLLLYGLSLYPTIQPLFSFYDLTFHSQLRKIQLMGIIESQEISRWRVSNALKYTFFLMKIYVLVSNVKTFGESRRPNTTFG